jgi:hypothetical protein
MTSIGNTSPPMGTPVNEIKPVTDVRVSNATPQEAVELVMGNEKVRADDASVREAFREAKKQSKEIASLLEEMKGSSVSLQRLAEIEARIKEITEGRSPIGATWNQQVGAK